MLGHEIEGENQLLELPTGNYMITIFFFLLIYFTVANIIIIIIII